MDDQLKNLERNAHLLLAKSCKALLSLRNPNSGGFYRNSKSTEAKLYPTASFHGFTALSECGIDSQGGSLYLDIDQESKDNIKKSTEEFFNHDNWFRKNLSDSLHSPKTGNGVVDVEELGRNQRVIITIERFLAFLNEWVDVSEIKNKNIESNLTDARNILTKFLTDKYFSPELGSSPRPLLLLVLSLHHYNSFIDKTRESFVKFKADRVDDSELMGFRKCAMEHLNHHMARANDDFDPSFDVVSLATALYAASLLDDELRFTPFFNSCIEVITRKQASNGCWPAGVSISFSDNGDVVQLPSVEIANYIAEAIIDQKVLVDIYPEVETTLELSLKAFRKFAKYLQATFQNGVNVDSGEIKVNGWANDRIGKADYVETWITAQASRFLYKYWLAEKALLRIRSMQELGFSEYRSGLRETNVQEFWKMNVIDPDRIANPTTKVKDRFIQPIIDGQKKDHELIYPSSNGKSFIIFGPPGSGKTYFVEKLAECLDWPLVDLSPGHFIKNGLEFIESTSKGIFELLGNLNHAVVFFDECDELFRTRSENKSEDTNRISHPRSILSFATASMLPKLQKLHDNGQVIFVLGTNYLQNIDSAVARPGRFDDIHLLDRPDEKARSQHIKNFLASNDIDESAIDELVKSTAGFTVKEVFQASKLHPHKLEETTLADYIGWCKPNGIGRLELDSSRYNDEVKKKISNRWDTIANTAKK